jgi:hypothetical protein
VSNPSTGPSAARFVHFGDDFSHLQVPDDHPGLENRENIL